MTTAQGSARIKLRFAVTHRNIQLGCVAWLSHGIVSSLALDTSGYERPTRVLRDLGPIDEIDEKTKAIARREVGDVLSTINDFLKCGVTWAALTSCRITGDDLLGIILTTVEAKRRESKRGTNVSQKHSGTR